MGKKVKYELTEKAELPIFCPIHLSYCVSMLDVGGKITGKHLWQLFTCENVYEQI